MTLSRLEPGFESPWGRQSTSHRLVTFFICFSYLLFTSASLLVGTDRNNLFTASCRFKSPAI